MDEVTQAAMKHAEALYKAGRRNEAIAELRKLNDPIARRILAQISGKQPVAQQKPVPKSGHYVRNLAIALMLSIVAVFGGIYLYGEVNRTQQQPRTELAWVCWDFSFRYAYELGRTLNASYTADLDSCYEWADYLIEYFPKTVDRCLTEHETDEARKACLDREGIDTFPRFKEDTD